MPAVVAEVESLLEKARNAAGALEQSVALSALQRADGLLREHPELPQSAWLMAEAWQLEGDVESAPAALGAATALRQRAAALEGQRATPFSDRAAEVAAATSEATALVRITGLEPGDRLEWDGRESLSPVSTRAGEHHARVLRNGRLLWAGWSVVSESETELRVPVPEIVACSPDDIAAGRFAAGRAVAAPHARCESYVLARTHVAGGIEAAVCEREICGQVVVWPEASRSPAHSASKRIWPYAVALSAGALAVTGLVLWRAGVFDRPDAATTTVWVLNPQTPQMGMHF